MLPAGGRLAAITSANCMPGDTAWADAFERFDPRVVFSTAIDGRAYARHGTTFDTRLTVLDKGGKNRDGRTDRSAKARCQRRRVARRPLPPKFRHDCPWRSRCGPWPTCSATSPHALGKPRPSAPARRWRRPSPRHPARGIGVPSPNSPTRSLPPMWTARPMQ